ncbi:hypothetical protein ALQ56_03493 [Pseudomonas syringae pv. papulans]|nr:hypothetical protein ALQ56_03493 [Pseudomonas syringae pv. papulans]
MAFSTQDTDEVLSEINVTPLVDVMLVLLWWCSSSPRRY